MILSRFSFISIRVKTNDAIANYNTGTSTLTLFTLPTAQRKLGNKTYPFCNQVDNVLITVNDRFVPHNASGTIDYFTAQVITESDYYPFGQLMPGRSNSPTTYKYGFQDQLKDDEIFNVTNTLVSAEFWEYDTRLGRRWNVDPMEIGVMSYYHAFYNNPIVYSDPLGLKPGGGGGKRGSTDCPTWGNSGGGISWKSHPAYATGSAQASAAASMLTNKYAQSLRKPIPQSSENTAHLDAIKKKAQMSENAGKMKSYADQANANLKRNKMFGSQNTTTLKDGTPDAQKFANYQLDMATDLIPGVPILKKYLKGTEITTADWIIEGASILPIGRILGKTFKLVSKSGELLTTGLKGAGKIGGNACIDYAESFIKTFKRTIEEVGGTVKRMEINIGSNGLIGTETKQLATTGKHHYIEVVIDGKVTIFDNYFSKGIPKEDYIKAIGGHTKARGFIDGRTLLEEAVEIK